MKKILTAAMFVLLGSSVAYAADMGMDCCKKCDCCAKESEETPAPPSE